MFMALHSLLVINCKMEIHSGQKGGKCLRDASTMRRMFRFRP